jgi:hypothetical protein
VTVRCQNPSQCSAGQGVVFDNQDSHVFNQRRALVVRSAARLRDVYTTHCDQTILQRESRLTTTHHGRVRVTDHDRKARQCKALCNFYSARSRD